MSDAKNVPYFFDENVSEGSPELTKILNMARGGQRPEAGEMKDKDLSDLMLSGRKHGVAPAAGEPEVVAYTETIWRIECPKCRDEFVAPDDDCASGASFTAECTSCGHKFPARAG